MGGLQPDLRAVFCEALDWDTPHERAAYLDLACHDRPDLRARVEALLRAHAEDSGFLDEPSGDSAPTVKGLAIGERPDIEIGPYRLLERIGEGGFGVVYLAEQRHPIRRKVALKVLKPGMDTRPIVARFEAERQALALMDHPNIARVLDGGTTSGEPGRVSPGRPYFVMELVCGVPITDYCDRAHLSLRQRLGLFVSVCHAVQHAHHKGIIHRDLKPSNVLVATYDGNPVVKVIDFGVAKALGQALTDQTLVTGTAQMIGTPLYMSPEQAGQGGLDIDTRSDVYSLGVLLYELLTGTTPLNRQRLKEATFLEVLRCIREDEPPSPSTRLGTSAELPSIAANRGQEPKQVISQVRGELDWIVVKCLEKDRNRRYETANGLARDLQRYLHDEPVQAGPPSAGYRVRKFVRRNRRGLTTAVLAGMLVLVAVGAVAGSLGWVARDQATRQAVVAAGVKQALQEVERLEEQRRWEEALAVADHAQSLVTSGGAVEPLGDELQEHRADLTLLVQVEKARLRLAEQPDLGASDNRFAFELLLPEYAQAFAAWGISPETTAPQQAAPRLKGRPDPLRGGLLAALHDWHSLASYYRRAEKEWLGQVIVLVDTDSWRGRMRDAQSRDDLPALQQLARDVDVARQPPEVLTLLGRGLLRKGAYAQAVDLLRQAQGQYPGDFWLNFYLGLAYSVVSEPQKAVRYYSAAVSLQPSAVAYLNLGSDLRKCGDREAAVAAYRKALALEPRYAKAHYNLGNVLGEMGRLDEAIAEYHESIRLNPGLPKTYHELGWALHRKGQLDEAIAAYQQAIRLQLPLPYAFYNYYELGNALRARGQLDDAVAAYQQAADHATVDDSRTQTSLSDLAWQLATAREPALAEPGRARRIAETVLQRRGEDLEIVFQHAGWLALTGDRTAYRRLCAQSLERFGMTTDVRTLYLLTRLCVLDVEPATDLDRLTAFGKRVVQAHATAFHCHTLGLVDYRARRFDEAIFRFRQSMDMDQSWPANVGNWLGLALALHHTGRDGEARQWVERARQYLSDHQKDPHWGMHPHDQIGCRLLLREAEELLGQPDGIDR